MTMSITMESISWELLFSAYDCDQIYFIILIKLLATHNKWVIYYYYYKV